MSRRTVPTPSASASDTKKAALALRRFFRLASRYAPGRIANPLTMHTASYRFRGLPGSQGRAWNGHTRGAIFVSGVGVETGIS
jgi:hypothetical protein